MTKPGPRLQLVEPDGVLGGLDRALQGGPPIAPLPLEHIERSQAMAMLGPDAPVSEPGAAAVIATSGSTGRPKGVVLSRDAIIASAHATHVRLGGPGDWALALPTHYVAGLMVLARTVVAGTTVFPCSGDLGDLPKIAGQLHGRRYLSIVSTQLSRALVDPATTEALAKFDAVLVGGGPVSSELRQRALAVDIPVVTTYGMSETCGGCVYDGFPLDGVAVSFGERDQILISGPMIFSSYRGRPDLTAKSLTGTTFRTQDRGSLVAGRLAVSGRLDDVVITGGLNVDLAQVERIARAATASELVILGIPDPDWGTMIVAVTSGDEDEHALRDVLAGSLPPYAVPRRLVRVDTLPLTAGGKIDRHRLRELIASERTRL